MYLVTDLFILYLLLVTLCAGEKPTDRPDQEDLLPRPLRPIKPFRYYRRIQVHHPRYWLDGHLAKKVAKTIDVKTKCFCMIEDQATPKVTQLLEFPGNSIKKLVVYLFQDESTGAVKIHIPNREKQRMLPDLTYDQDDFFAPVSNERISELLSSENSLKIPNPLNVNQVIKKHSWPMHTINNQPYNYAQDQAQPDSLEDYPYTSNEEPVSDHVIREINSDVESPAPEKESHSEEISVGNKITNDENRDEELEYNTEAPEENKITNDENRYEEPEYNTETPEENPSDNNYPLAYNHGKLTFDDWFMNQIKNVEQQRALKYNSVDLKSLKELIEKTLLENGISLTNNGVLMDSSNHRIDMGSLKLRTVLIGRPMNFDRFIKGTGEKYKLPTDIPYLEAIFLNLENPWKILGVIPLGWTFLPNNGNQVTEFSGSNRRNENPYKKLYINLRKSNKIKTNPLEKFSEITKSSGKGKLLKGGNIFNNKFLGQYRAILPNQQKDQFNVKSKPDDIAKSKENFINVVKNSIERTAVLNENFAEPYRKSKNFRRFKINNLLDTQNLKNLFSNIFGHSKEINHVQEHHHKHDGHSAHDELPGFRIIGGYPATSSGHPLLIKGRTGSSEENPDSSAESPPVEA